MTYSSALVGCGTSALEDAQRNKIDQLLDRLRSEGRHRLLEIGCGWGSLAIEAARRGANVVGLTLSTEQKAWAEREIAGRGLTDRIEIRLQDYRDIAEQFDAIASVEMVEAVGRRWWGAYLDCIARNLKPGGRAALQFIFMRAGIVRSLCAQRRLHPDLHLPWRNADQRAASFAALAQERGLSLAGPQRRLRRGLCAHAETLAAEL